MRKKATLKPSKIEILSLGCGVQSSTLALMASEGIIGPMPEAAVFADTGDEPEEVYRWLQFIRPRLAFPVFVVSAGKLSVKIIEAAKSGKFASAPPLFTSPNQPGGRPGMLPRQCTQNAKIRPVHRESRRIMREAGAQRVVQWVGISVDEVERLKPSGRRWIENRWPLCEMRMSRNDCLQWMRRRGYPEPPRSACVYCPHKSDAEWRWLRDRQPDDWLRAVEFDSEIRNGVNHVLARSFVHESCLPLGEAPIDLDAAQGLLWGNECSGGCGV